MEGEGHRRQRVRLNITARRVRIKPDKKRRSYIRRLEGVMRNCDTIVADRARENTGQRKLARAKVEEGVPNYKVETGKGGYRRIYSPKLDESGFKKHIAKTIISSLIRDFPEETNEALKDLSLI